MLTLTGWSNSEIYPEEYSKVDQTFWAKIIFPKVFFEKYFLSFIFSLAPPPLLFYAKSYKML
jgi:hypothetical protein